MGWGWGGLHASTHTPLPLVPLQGLTEAESYKKYFAPFVGRDLDTSPTMLLGSLNSGERRGRGREGGQGARATPFAPTPTRPPPRRPPPPPPPPNALLRWMGLLQALFPELAKERPRSATHALYQVCARECVLVWVHVVGA